MLALHMIPSLSDSKNAQDSEDSTVIVISLYITDVIGQ